MNRQPADSGLLKRNWLLSWLSSSSSSAVWHNFWFTYCMILWRQRIVMNYMCDGDSDSASKKTGLISCEPIVLSVANEFDVIFLHSFYLFISLLSVCCVCRSPLCHVCVSTAAVRSALFSSSFLRGSYADSSKTNCLFIRESCEFWLIRIWPNRRLCWSFSEAQIQFIAHIRQGAASHIHEHWKRTEPKHAYMKLWNVFFFCLQNTICAHHSPKSLNSQQKNLRKLVRIEWKMGNPYCFPKFA